MVSLMKSETVTKNQFEHIPAVILAGGRPVLHESIHTERLNKALVRINNKPLIWWNLLHYAKHGVRDFIIAAGLQADRILAVLNKELGAIVINDQQDAYVIKIASYDCKLRLVNTGSESNTAQRLLACKPYLQDRATFCLTYSDTLSDVNLTDELVFHQTAGRIATIVAAQMPVRFRVLGIRHSEYLVRAFANKPVIQAVPINGGYYLLQREFLSEKYLGKGESPIEEAPLERLALNLQLGAFEHRGAWQHLDGERDIPHLETVANIISGELSQTR